MELFFWIIIFTIGLIALVKAADFLTDNAVKLGRVLGLSEFVIGVLIVAFGTSLPEFATSIMAKIGGESAVVTSNIFGTVIVNILLGFGLTFFLVKKVIIEKDIYYGNLSIFIGAVILIVFTSLDGIISTVESMLYLIVFIIYLFFLFRNYQIEKKLDIIRPKFFWKYPVIIISSLAIICVASKYIVDALIYIGESINLPASIIAATALALGTSLPEIAVAVSAARKGQFNLLMGDILGSNIFDVLFIIGSTGIFGGLLVSVETVYVIIPFMIATTFLFWVICHDRKIIRTEGFIMLIIYVLFVAKLFNLF